ncbi:glycoside-pentoside-hexuronide (GPH):cation symporter [Virgibacillus halophilus]|uniref:Glycoside-pentoside-hexuronide (GPH):cation symporter n=1 Tax=Tigheibacillus halophilus TaxID=361280 RepID=A0ABU5C2B0_9BACI|nr:glycoside-pentoside-hexuronide (GPH):cation symporter [Virgibacillus halophilus]
MVMVTLLLILFGGWLIVTCYFFYTDVFGITAAAAGTLFLVTRIFDAVNDPIMGIIVDKTKSKHGKTRPYLLYVAIPFGILSIITFITPDLSVTGKVVYAYITYGLLGIVYTMINIPYGALMPLMSRNSKEKGELNSYRAIGRSVGAIIVASLTLPLVNFLGGGNQQLGFPVVMGIYSVIGVVFFWLTFKNCHERVQTAKPDQKNPEIKKSLVQMFKNKYWLLVSANSFLWFVRMGIMNGVLIYYVNYVLKEPNMAPFYLTLLNIANLVGGFFALSILRKFSSRNSSMLMYGLAAVLLASLFLVEGQSMILFSIIFFAANVLIGYGDPATLTMLGDSIDYQEWKFGTRPEGLLVSSYSFSTKFGVAIGSSFLAYALSWAGYDPNAITEGAKTMIRTLMLSLPILITVLQVIILYCYKLDKHHADIVKDLNL